MRKKGRVKEYLTLFFLSLSVSCKNLIEFCKVVFFYYRNFSFAKTDLFLLSSYFFKSPFKISKQFLLKKGKKDVYLYGETPITSMAEIAKLAGIEENDHVFELGMGRGRCCFWLHFFIGCKVTGIEFVPKFVQIANSLKKRLQIENILFLQEDMLKSAFQEATIFYLYGTCYDEIFIRALIEKFKKLPKGTKIITVSYPLNDYAKTPYFEVVKKFEITFTWGQADVYLQIVR
ncbi:MAG TPA: methyltransferase domain-containing protein [Parachlamydiaceae bacterium]|nr:methyltransferase domain-containing protein [Parachlamydiaceae bacterium]